MFEKNKDKKQQLQEICKRIQYEVDKLGFEEKTTAIKYFGLTLSKDFFKYSQNLLITIGFYGVGKLFVSI